MYQRFYVIERLEIKHFFIYKKLAPAYDFRPRMIFEKLYEILIDLK